MEYGLFESILGALHRVSDRDIKGFRSRLRILRDIDVPAVIRPGKGARVDYRFEDVFMGHLGLTLDQAGFPPLVIKDIAEQIAELGIISNFMRRKSQGSADLWLRLSPLRHSFDGERRCVLFELEPLANQFKFLKAQKSPRAPEMIAAVPKQSMLYGLVNLSEIYAECEREMSIKYGMEPIAAFYNMSERKAYNLAVQGLPGVFKLGRQWALDTHVARDTVRIKATGGR